MLMDNVQSLFGIEVVETSTFVRNDQDKVINLFLKSRDGSEFFLKEVQEHSMREGLDKIYECLGRIQTDRVHLLLPLSQRVDSTKFLFQSEGKNFLLFKKETFQKFDVEKYPLSKLFEDLIWFQKQMAGFTFSRQDYRTYESWILMGLDRMVRKLGCEPEYIKSFKSFMENKFSQIQFSSGNIHWDIHEDNLGFLENGKLVLLDFDLVQEGPFANDLIAASAMYVNWERPYRETSESFFEDVYKRISSFAPGMSLADMKYLISRSPMGEWSLLQSRNEMAVKVEGLVF